MGWSDTVSNTPSCCRECFPAENKEIVRSYLSCVRFDESVSKLSCDLRTSPATSQNARDLREMS